MSNKSWMEEFYPVPAKVVPAQNAIKHSLVKWYGLRKANLKKHGIYESPIGVNGDTCALCCSHPGCGGCPLYDFKGSVCKYDKGIFGIFHTRNNPEPMIAALEAIEFVERTCK